MNFVLRLMYCIIDGESEFAIDDIFISLGIVHGNQLSILGMIVFKGTLRCNCYSYHLRSQEYSITCYIQVHVPCMVLLPCRRNHDLFHLLEVKHSKY